MSTIILQSPDIIGIKAMGPMVDWLQHISCLNQSCPQPFSRQQTNEDSQKDGKRARQTDEIFNSREIFNKARNIDIYYESKCY